ncbi:MAG: arginine--tRNA ligase [Bacteroidota bacterium]
MNTIEPILVTHTIDAVKVLYQGDIQASQINISATRKEFEGDFTLMIFPLVKVSKKSPEQTAEDIGVYLLKHVEAIESYNIIKGFLNLKLQNAFWANFLSSIVTNENHGQLASTGKKIILEYTGPNSNKPLHLGHVRNMLLGYSLSNLLSAAGNEVTRLNIYNDRGIAICKSMYAWQTQADGLTPQTANEKGDHFVGKYYALYSKLEKEESETKGIKPEDTDIAKACKKMLLDWEAGNEDLIRLWKEMNKWVYDAHQVTFDSIGISFDKVYYESENYLLGKQMVLDGLAKGVYYKRTDGAVCVDLTADGLDEKVLLRPDGTSIYLTQDIGVAHQRYEDYHPDRSLYVVGNEQDYHFKVLKLCLQKLGEPYADGVEHISYGLVELPSGRLKSREGNIVDADDLIQGVLEIAAERTKEQGKVDSLSATELQNLYRTIGLGALKYFILKVAAVKRIVFNPEESIDFQGNTGPFIQYTHARICSILRKKGATSIDNNSYQYNELENEILRLLYHLPHTIKAAADAMDPAIVANNIYEIAKTYSKYYSAYKILNAEDENTIQNRINLSKAVANAIKFSLNILGIDAPERM